MDSTSNRQGQMIKAEIDIYRIDIDIDIDIYRIAKGT